MTSVSEAEKIILLQARDYGTIPVPFDLALGHVLAEDIKADRDFPPYDRVTMDGIAISFASFEKGIRSFHIKAVQAAGDTPIEIEHEHECIEIMTGAALPATTDTVVRYEDSDIKNGTATLTIDNIRKGQSVHQKGKDKKKGETIVVAGTIIDPTVISIAATVGMTTLKIKKTPRVVVISTGDELVAINDQPTPYQIRSSNSHTIKAVLKQYHIETELLHIPDDPQIMLPALRSCVEKYDVLILSGGVSKGKYDHLPQVLNELKVEKLFHGVQQRPGKPFWFGTHPGGALVFAFPGNPVSAFMCLHRYFLPWHFSNSKLKIQNSKLSAVLNDDFSFAPELQYFLQVTLHTNELGQLLATPMEGNGSGDFANLLNSNAFMELPGEKSNFKKGEVYNIWPFKQVIA